ncbi:MAG: mechanosensitive ion channel [Jaaginema sp. PMC 1079.18]|nr:mechanosensitive ion channel [Jaaginema sp. PMC 1080.18]MEC4852700.1 mechanosensitive ion channel [Jaaginema sp. PMC 1079.18]MEC4865970.1 mechanosensitive ion channel [Jaaginema sp. PMC 1078.18]
MNNDIFPLNDLPQIVVNKITLKYSLIGIAIAVLSLAIFYFFQLVGRQLTNFLSPQVKQGYQKIVDPYKTWLTLTILLVVADLIILIFPTPSWSETLEIIVGIFAGFAVTLVGSRLFRQLFDLYILGAAIQSKRKVDSEILILIKWLGNIAIIFIVFTIFAQTHQINILGLIASLGVGGLAIAFAAQKTLEQILGGIVLYIDRPFVVDDYIGLPDGTFGRVESIGLRSTKIRTSGKGTLVIVPNNALTQINIENFTGAKKVISLIYLTFHYLIPAEEQAFIRQIILDSTRDIFGVDPRSTEVKFTEMVQDGKNAITQAQINFFILGSGEVSMDLRRQLLDVANQSIARQLQEYGIAFDLEERTINVDSPITI